MGSIVGIALVCSLAPETLGVFSGSCTGDQNIDLKQIGCQIFLQQRGVTVTENHSLGSATVASFRRVPAQQGEESYIYRGKRKLRGLQ